MNKAIFSSMWRVVIALVFTLSLVLVMAVPAAATTWTATFLPISGPVGTTITVTTGTGWTGNETITDVTVGGAAATHTLTVNGGGNLTGNITVPAVVGGLKTIVITGSLSGAQTFTGAFTVTATATFNPVIGPVGTVIAVTGTGWTGNETIAGTGNVTVGGANATYNLTVLNGALTGNITVPTLAVGLKTIVITGSSSGAQTFTGAFTVTAPTAVFDPVSGPVGTTITVTGTYWVASETISAVKVGNTTAAHTLTVGGTGNLTGTITVPTVTVGLKTIVITGATSGNQTFAGAFTVTTATATFVPVSGPVGITITVTGTGWVGKRLFLRSR